MEIIRFFLCFGSGSDFFYGVRILIDKKIRIQKLSLSTKNWFNTASVNIYNDRNKNFNPKETSNLPDGEMLLLDKTPFKPECCPNVYSNSSGCACMSASQSNYLLQRGNNNVPFSEY